jgi:hypothetical protein
VTDEEFDSAIAMLQAMFGSAPQGPRGGMLPRMKADTEYHRMPGGRADEMAPVSGPSTNSMIGPGPVAPWLPAYDDLQEQMPVHMGYLPRYFSS